MVDTQASYFLVTFFNKASFGVLTKFKTTEAVTLNFID